MSRTPRSGLLRNLATLCHVVESSALADLTELETKALFVYLYHANNLTGEAWPSMQRVANHISGGNKNRARKAIQGLVRRHLLEPVSPGGGAGNSARYRLGAGSASAPLSPDEKGVDSGAERGLVRDEKGVGLSTKMGSVSGPRTTNGTTQGTTHTTTAEVCVSDAPHHAQVRTGKIESPPATDPPGFVTLWKEYPRHRATKSHRTQALDVWNAQGLETHAAAILTALRRFKESEAWGNEGGRFVPAIVKWLSDEGWQQAPATVSSGDSESFGFVFNRVVPTADELAAIDGACQEHRDRQRARNPQFSRFWSAFPREHKLRDPRQSEQQAECECLEHWDHHHLEGTAHRIVEAAGRIGETADWGMANSGAALPAILWLTRHGWEVLDR